MIRVYFLVLATWLAMAVPAQFDSGSTGASGELLITANTVLPVPPDGVFEFTSVTVSEGATLSFEPGLNVPPVTFLTTGDVVIEGTIYLRGQSSSDSPTNATPAGVTLPGPGGFPGGIGGMNVVGVITRAQSGGGPGGGAASLGLLAPNSSALVRGGNSGSHFTVGANGSFNVLPAAPTYGDARLLALTGGSGGAGSTYNSSSASLNGGQSGGAGGGAIAIISSGTITVNGTINANGGSGGGLAANGGQTYGSGSGAGGAIRLVANEVLGEGTLQAIGGGYDSTANNGGNGRIVLEAFNLSQTLRVNCDPPPGTSLPTIVGFDSAERPSVRIVSFGGMPVMDPPTGSLINPDVTLGEPSTMVVAEMETTNVPDGAMVDLRITLSNGDVLQVESFPVSAETAAALIELPPEAGLGTIYPTIDFNN